MGTCVRRGWGVIDNGNPSDVVPLQPYSEDDPVPQTVNGAFFERWAKHMKWTDYDMPHQVVISGVESRSRCTKSCIIFGHHGGLRRHFSEAEKVIRADTAAGFTRAGRAHPWMFPFIATARNCVERKLWRIVAGKLTRVVKWRVTTDDSIGVDDEVSRNDGIDPASWPRAGLPLPQTLAEAVAIVKAVCEAMGVGASQAVYEMVAVWALDLTHAYRMLSVQRMEWPQQSYIWYDGVRLDLRCLFGTASMVEFFQRVSFFVMSVARRRIREFDAQHPYSAAREAWRAWRAANVEAPEGEHSSDCTAGYIYLDDKLGCTPVQRDEPISGRVSAATQPIQLSLHVEQLSDCSLAVVAM